MHTEPTPAQVARALGRAERGVALDAEEATALLHARGGELERLLVVASRVRDQALAGGVGPGWSPTRARCSSR